MNLQLQGTPAQWPRCCPEVERSRRSRGDYTHVTDIISRSSFLPFFPSRSHPIHISLSVILVFSIGPDRARSPRKAISPPVTFPSFIGSARWFYTRFNILASTEIVWFSRLHAKRRPPTAALHSLLSALPMAEDSAPRRVPGYLEIVCAALATAAV